jgi:hypothetical protein
MKKIENTNFINDEDFDTEGIFKYFDDPDSEFSMSDNTPDLKLNKNKFRCEEFVKYSDKDIILCAGCSVTFGVGLNEDEIWPKLLQKLIGYKKVDMYNISHPGWSAFNIISNVFLYLKNFKKPTEIYILLPDERRLSGYSMIQKTHGTFILAPGIEDTDQETKEQMMLASAIHIRNYLSMLEEYCRVQNIKLFVTTWNENNFINRNYEFSSRYQPYSITSALMFIKKYQKENPNDEFIFFARDRSQENPGHHGTGHHAYWAEMFYKIRQETL